MSELHNAELRKFSNGVKKDIFRIIDANLNRSREGLRVCEDMARFILNSQPLAKELKSVRHRISAIAEGISADSPILFSSRNSEEDVGRAARMKSEMERPGLIGIFNANMERVKEGLRVLEEFFKLIDKKTSRKCSALRFEIYDIEKKAVERHWHR